MTKLLEHDWSSDIDGLEADCAMPPFHLSAQRRRTELTARDVPAAHLSRTREQRPGRPRAAIVGAARGKICAKPLIFYRASRALTSGIDCPTSRRQTTTGACLQRVGSGRLAA